MIAPAAIRPRPLPDPEPALGEELHPVLRRVLLARGVRSAAELKLGLDAMLAPGALSGITEAASLLADAVEAGQRILVVGDFDADGATGTAVAVLALRAMGAAYVDFRVPNRFEFGYGLTPALVETLAPQMPDLLVTVDAGIGCLAGVQRARALGSRVIVTDHHLPGDALPAADAIVNPNCAGDAFPSKALAGVGVVFYLAGRTRQLLRERGWFGRSRPEPNLAAVLDLVALGTVADLVPLDHNNRVLVRQGLERIRRGLGRPGVMALLRAGERDYRFASAADLGFAVAPRLNAAGRLEDMSVGIRCLLSQDRAEADRLAAQLDGLNRQRRGMQDQMQAEAMSQVQELADSLRAEAGLPPAVCLFDERWHQGIVGLVAGRVKDAVHRPVVAFAPQEDGAALLKGSARSIPGLHMRDVLVRLDALNPGLMRAFGGHAMAAGLTLAREHLPAFREAFERAVSDAFGGESPDAEILTDGSLHSGDLGLSLARLLEDAGPWGQRFPEPLFDGRFAVIGQRVVGGAHLKLRLRPAGGGEVIDAIAFQHLPEDVPDSATVRCLYRLEVNRWRGEEACQLRIERIVREGAAVSRD